MEPYGVGNDQHPERVDFGITVLKTVPVVYFVGEARMQLTADELYNQQRFHIKCMEHRVSFPPLLKRTEWMELITRNLEDAVEVEPGELYQEGGDQLGQLKQYVDFEIRSKVKAFGDEYLNGKMGEIVRVRIKERRIYFKWYALKTWMTRQSSGWKEIEKMRAWLNKNGIQNPRDQGREWFRSSFSVSLTVWDLLVLKLSVQT